MHSLHSLPVRECCLAAVTLCDCCLNTHYYCCEHTPKTEPKCALQYISASTTILSSLSRQPRQPQASKQGIQYIKSMACFKFCFASPRNFSFLSKLNRTAFGTLHIEWGKRTEGRRQKGRKKERNEFVECAGKSLPCGVRTHTDTRTAATPPTVDLSPSDTRSERAKHTHFLFIW